MFKVCFEVIWFGKYTENYFDRFTMLLKLVKKQDSLFAKNRITEITNEKNVDFRYIKTRDNPGDLSNRGMSTTGRATS